MNITVYTLGTHVTVYVTNMFHFSKIRQSDFNIWAIHWHIGVFNPLKNSIVITNCLPQIKPDHMHGICQHQCDPCKPR